jgi:maltooligosyltrehalose trehalohydrolase
MPPEPKSPLSPGAVPFLGAEPLPGGARFALFCTTARTCSVQLHERPGVRGQRLPMAPAGDGLFEVQVPGAGHGTLYNFILDDREVPDPYARFLPHGVDGPAMVFQSRHRWRHGPGIARPLREQVFYELHVGTFTEGGTYQAARERLGELSELGVTALELMPIAAFAGQRGWGYDGVALYAPFAPYGTPDDLRAFIDDAHGHGLSVVLDVVYNHLGPAGNYLASYSPEYFTSAARNAWGDAPNFAHPAMRRYVIDNARYWLSELRFDGLRLDAIHAIVDPSPHHVLADLAREVARLGSPRLLVAEDERNDPADIDELGLDAVWADDFHHQVRVSLTHECDGYYAGYQPGLPDLVRTIQGGWLYQGQDCPTTGRPRGKPAPHLPAEAFIYCLQNHDQVGNRALGDRLSHTVDPDGYRAVSTLLLFLPMTPLLFMGQEWAASSPFQFFTDHEPELGTKIVEGRRREFAGFRAFVDPAARARIPDPQELATFLRSRLGWDERNVGEHARVLALYRELLALRRGDPVLKQAGREALEVRAHGDLLTVRRWHGDDDRLLLVNLGPEPLRQLPPGASGRALILRSDGERRFPEVLPGNTAVVLGSHA